MLREENRQLRVLRCYREEFEALSLHKPQKVLGEMANLGPLPIRTLFANSHAETALATDTTSLLPAPRRASGDRRGLPSMNQKIEWLSKSIPHRPPPPTPAIPPPAADRRRIRPGCEEAYPLVPQIADGALLRQAGRLSPPACRRARSRSPRAVKKPRQDWGRLAQVHGSRMPRRRLQARC